MAKFLVLWTLCTAAILFAASAPAQTAGWLVHRDQVHGCRLEYPAFVFSGQQDETDGPDKFSGPNDHTHFRIMAAENVPPRTTAEIRAEYLRSNIPGEITYERMKPEFLVLSGYRGEEIFYTKVSISEDGNVACILEIAYPRRDKKKYDGIVTRMSRSFAHRPAEQTAPGCEKVLLAPARYRPETVELCEIVSDL